MKQDILASYDKKQVDELYRSMISHEDVETADFEEVKDIDDVDITGDYEINYYKRCGEYLYILCNERVDVSAIVFDEGRQVLKVCHYHRRGKYGLHFYKLEVPFIDEPYEITYKPHQS